MSQHDMNIANQGFPAFRADLNSALAALVSNNSGATAPTTTFANMPWYDTANNIFKIRNEDNDAWISVFTLDQTTDAITAIGSVTLADVVSLTGTQTLTNKTLTSPTLTNPTVDKINTGIANAVIGAGNASIMKNRIINGAMVIDQRNAGASVTANNGIFGVDRFKISATQSSKGTMQQNAGSVTPPAGFKNYLGLTSSSAFTPASGDLIALLQRVEGYNIADLGWGAAGAKTVTLSFWVYSSLTGTFGGGIGNDAGDYTYPFSYTISAANTWEQKTITIAGPTSGNWLSTNGTGINLSWSLATGSTFSGTAGAWTGSVNAYNATGATQPFSTNGATWYITGVQLEVGSSATGFEYVNYQTSLANCQRYCQIVPKGIFGRAESGTIANLSGPRCVTMRASPSTTKTANGLFNVNGVGQVDITSINSSGSTATGFYIQVVVNGNVSSYYGYSNSDTWAYESAEL